MNSKNFVKEGDEKRHRAEKGAGCITCKVTGMFKGLCQGMFLAFWPLCTMYCRPKYELCQRVFDNFSDALLVSLQVTNNQLLMYR